MEEEKVQLYPSKVRIVPNFKLAKVTSNLSESSYNRLINGKSAEIVEKKKHKKFGEIVSTFTIKNSDDYDGTDPLNVFDDSVASACMSEWEAGNRYTTPAIILRAITGKKTGANGGTANGAVNPDQRAAIINSLQKLMGTIISIDLTDTNKKLGYDGTTKITSAILPAKIVAKTINGQIVDEVIYFDRESPLLTVAKQRKQLLTYDAELLDVPNQNNTPLVIMIKNYVMQRIQEIKLHKMTPTLTIEDIFKKCRISDATKRTKQHARECLEKFFAHLQEKGEIDSFELTKKGNKIYSITFTYTKKSKTFQPATATNSEAKKETDSETENKSVQNQETNFETKSDSNSETKSGNNVAQVFSKPEKIRKNLPPKTPTNTRKKWRQNGRNRKCIND